MAEIKEREHQWLTYLSQSADINGDEFVFNAALFGLRETDKFQTEDFFERMSWYIRSRKFIYVRSDLYPDYKGKGRFPAVMLAQPPKYWLCIGRRIFLKQCDYGTVTLWWYYYS
jgi:hypothetical protein